MLLALEDGGNQATVQIMGSTNIKAQLVDVVTLWSTMDQSCIVLGMRKPSLQGSPFIQCLCENLRDESFLLDEWSDLLDAHLVVHVAAKEVRLDADELSDNPDLLVGPVHRQD